MVFADHHQHIESIPNLRDEIPLHVLDELEKLQDSTAAIIAPPTSVEDILNDLLDLDGNSLNLPITKSHSMEEMSHNVLYSLDTAVFPLDVVSPLRLDSTADKNWNILEYTNCDADTSTSNISWNFGEEKEALTGQHPEECEITSQLDANANCVEIECTKWDADASNNNGARNLGGDVMQTQCELTPQLEILKASGYIGCDVYTWSNGVVRYCADAVEAQTNELTDSAQQYIVVCSPADETPEMRHECNVCLKSFRWKWHFTNHMKIHNAPRRYNCDVCQKSFSKKWSLDEHLNIHTGKKPYECETCKMTFYRRGSLNQHLKSHSGVTRYECELCNRTFLSKWNLNDHLKVHSDARPHQCKVCEKSFRFKRCLAVHSKIH